MQHRNHIGAFGIIGVLFIVVVPAAAQNLPPNDDITRILKERVDAEGQTVGIVAGLIDANGQRVVSYGQVNQGDTRPLNGDTVFEIGSVTKVFTSMILADMVLRGDLALDDPAVKYLTSSVTLPTRNGRQITLVDLATHTSGLPDAPTNITPKDFANPWADYTVAQLYQFLGSFQLQYDIGTHYEYSNIGVGVLSNVITQRAGMDYETLVHQRILDPLGMKNTAITLTSDMKARLAVGHTAELQPAENWDLPAIPGAGALRSTANDLLVLLSAELGYRDSPLKSAMAFQLSTPLRPTTRPNVEMALGWAVSMSPTGPIVWHNGGTGGYRAFVGFNPRERVGVVLLSNAETPAGMDDIGFHLLDPTRPLSTFHPPAMGADTQAELRLAGDWDGSLIVQNGNRLRVVLHVKPSPSGAVASMDSLDQNTFNIPVSGLVLSGTTVHFDITLGASASFSGTLGSNGDTIEGALGGRDVQPPLSLTFTRRTEATTH